MGNILKKYNLTKAQWEVVGGAITGDTLPIGSIIPFGGTEAPTGWLICDGSGLNRETYKELFAAIGTNFGTDGPGNFYIPDLRGKVVVGQNASETEFSTLGKTGGEKTHTLTVNEMPSHNHGGHVKVTNSSALALNGDSGGGDNFTCQISAVTNNATQFAEIPTQGGSQAHNNLQPYQVTNYIIKAFQSSGVVAQVSNTKSESTTDTYSCDYVNRFGKNLWSGEFTSGSITVEGLSNYKVIIVWLFGGIICIGNTSWGIGGIGEYASYTNKVYSYRFLASGNTLTIDNVNKGGSNGMENVPVVAIHGLF